MSRAKGIDIDLGLAVSALSLRYGETRSYRELGAFCNVHHSAIQHIAEKALRKLRHSARLKILEEVLP